MSAHRLVQWTRRFRVCLHSSAGGGAPLTSDVALLPLLGGMNFPTFKYHQDRIATGSVKRSDTRCVLRTKAWLHSCWPANRMGRFRSRTVPLPLVYCG
jgi:hypothetical protein